jgi:D-alanyl-D-alanine carboxypeptidase/D-alanyl-D-alanine-endopeptidase (penicillin-binding protein 4)
VKTTVSSRIKSRRSRARRLRRLVTLLALIVVIAAVWLVLRPRAPRAGVAAPLPGASPRAAAAPKPAPTARPWTPAQLASLRASFQTIFAPAIEGSARHSLVVIDAAGRVIYDDGGSHAVIPASVQKLIVAYAALNLLQPSYRFHTMLAESQAMSNGRLDGDLWLIGSGDPSLRSKDLRAGVAALYKEGLRAIAGGVAIDSSAMQGPEINPRWDPADANEDYQTATSGISIDGDTVEFRVYGRAPGEPARVAVVPPSNDVHVTGSITTSSGTDDVVIAGLEDPNTFHLDGYIPANTEEKYWLPIHDIPRYAGSVLQAMLRRQGITTSRPPSSGDAPLTSILLWDHRSAPLNALERHMLYVSDNHYAEQLLRTIGADAQTRGTDLDGIEAETQFLRSRGIPTAGMHLVDGSGLAEANRVTAMTLARILSDAELHEGAEHLYALLPAGGEDGTLKHYGFTAALGRIRAKTGHLSDAASLAGYVDTEHHGRVAFAFMINGSPGDPDGAYVSAVDRLAQF